MDVILYTGKDCCLCEQAESLLKNLQNVSACNVSKVDIRSTTDLYHLYGARIPVLFRQDNNQELPWPFDESQLKEFMF